MLVAAHVLVAVVMVKVAMDRIMITDAPGQTGQGPRRWASHRHAQVVVNDGGNEHDCDHHRDKNVSGDEHDCDEQGCYEHAGGNEDDCDQHDRDEHAGEGKGGSGAEGGKGGGGGGCRDKQFSDRTYIHTTGGAAGGARRRMDGAGRAGS
jgi:hypothetical protein